MCECPEFVGIVEAGTVLNPHTRKIAEQYMAPLRKKTAGGGGKVDALIYGCTHYPILKEVVEDVLYNSFGYCRSEVKLVNPAETLVDKMDSLISPPTRQNKKRGSVRFCVNADSAGFAERAQRILGYDVSTLCEVVDLQA
jgi:glutamate racemase